MHIRGIFRNQIPINFEKVLSLFQMLQCPTCGGVATFKTGRQEVPDSNPGRAYQPRRSEFSVIFSETRVNTG